MLLNPAQLKLLEGRRLQPQRLHSGTLRGERISPRKGLSIEFADFRSYAAGDDLRHLDWNILARLDRASIRTYQDEQELPVYVLVDLSASMTFGNPEKVQSAKIIAAAIAYAGLCGGDAVAVLPLGAPARPRFVRGRSSFTRLQEGLERTSAAPAAFAAGIQRFLAHSRRPGMIFVVSDALDPAAQGALSSLTGRGDEVVFVQVLSPEDLDPELEGDLRLVDAEDGAAVDITATAGALRQYRHNLDTHNQALQQICLKRGAHYIPAFGIDLERTLQALQRTGVLR